MQIKTVAESKTGSKQKSPVSKQSETILIKDQMASFVDLPFWKQN